MDADKWFWLVIFAGIALAALSGCAPGDAGLLGEALASPRAPVIAAPIGEAYPWSILPYAILTDLSDE